MPELAHNIPVELHALWGFSYVVNEEDGSKLLREINRIAMGDLQRR